MKYRIQYINNIDKQTVIDANKDKFIVAEENYINGENYITFSDTKPIETQLQEQADNQLTIMEAIADLYTTLVP